MDPTCLVSRLVVVFAGGGVLGTADLSIVADDVHHYVATVYHLLIETSNSIMQHVAN